MNLEEENTLIDNFLSGTLSGQELENFEKRMSDDIRFRESVLLQKQLQEALNEDDWSFAEEVNLEIIKSYETEFRRQETKDLAKTLGQINAEYQSTPPEKGSNYKSWLLYLSAAIIAVLLAVKVLLFSAPTTEELYVDYFDVKEIPSLVVRGENQEQLTKAQSLFEEGNYRESLAILEAQLPLVNKQKATIYIYKGIAEMELENYEAATATFEILSSSELLDASKGLWYRAILEMKKGNLDSVRKALERIVESPSNFKFKTAQTLLDQL